MLVRGEDLDRFARVLCRLLGNGIRELLLNAAASSGVADFGFFERGFSGSTSRSPSTLPSPAAGRPRVRLESASHPSRNLAARPQPAIGRRVVKAQAQFGEQVGLQDRCRCAVATAQVAKSLGLPRHCSGRAIVRSIARHRPSSPTHLRDGVTTRQKPDYLEVPRCAGILTSHKPLFQLLDTQMIPRPSPCVPISRLMAPKLICFARPCESLST